jgi:thiamine biosynthesis lipoprotein ApbE
MLTGAREPASASWGALGTSVVLKLTDPGALAHARRIVEQHLQEIDRACSRFRADSELARLNARAGASVRVGPLLLQAVEVALRAARLTDGDVDPALGEALVIAGYDRDYALLEHPAPEREDGAPKRGAQKAPAGGRSAPRVLARRTAGWHTIAIDHERSTIRTGRGVRLDLGATAKALAADRAAHSAHEATGAGVLVSLGGDIALAGPGPPCGWRVFVTDDHRSDLDAEGQTISISSGGLATSSTTTRRWIHDGQRMHHIIDPATNAPVESTWRTVSVAASTCVDANIASTAALVRGGSCVVWLAKSGLPARLVAQDGRVLRVSGWPADTEHRSEVFQLDADRPQSKAVLR